jgi:hypothetical protein
LVPKQQQRNSSERFFINILELLEEMIRPCLLTRQPWHPCLPFVLLRITADKGCNRIGLCLKGTRTLVLNTTMDFARQKQEQQYILASMAPRCGGPGTRQRADVPLPEFRLFRIANMPSELKINMRVKGTGERSMLHATGLGFPCQLTDWLETRDT